MHLCQESPSTGEQWCTNSCQRRLWWPLCEFRAWWRHMGGLAKWIMWSADPNRSRQRLPWNVKWNMKLKQVTVAIRLHCPAHGLPGWQWWPSPLALLVLVKPCDSRLSSDVGFKPLSPYGGENMIFMTIYMTIKDVEGYWKTRLDILKNMNLCMVQLLFQTNGKNASTAGVVGLHSFHPTFRFTPNSCELHLRRLHHVLWTRRKCTSATSS